MPKSKVEIEDVVTLIAEIVSANSERAIETSVEDVEEILASEGIGPKDFRSVTGVFIDYAGTAEGWTLDEIRTVLKALKRTPAEMAALGAKLLAP